MLALAEEAAALGAAALLDGAAADVVGWAGVVGTAVEGAAVVTVTVGAGAVVVPTGWV